MRKFFALGIVLLLGFFGCSQKEEIVKLKKGTPAYQLAKDLSSILPSLDPEENTVLISSKEFQITAGEVIKVIRDNIGNRTSQLTGLDAESLKNVIEQNAMLLAQNKLLVEAATKASIVVAQEELDNALSQEYNQAGGEEKFLELLRSSEISIDHVKESIRVSLLTQKYLDTVIQTDVEITEEEIQNVYQEDKTASVRHILLLTQGKTDPEKTEIYKKMEGILARARSGEDFSALAKEFSEDGGSKDKGGLYEDFPRGRMVKPFEDAAFTVPVGEISGIIETVYGYHILKVMDRKKETRPLDEVQPQIETQIKQKKVSEALQAHVEKLKEEAGLKTVGF